MFITLISANAAKIYAFLVGLSNSEPFAMVIEFMSSSEKQEVKAFMDKLEQKLGDGTDVNKLRSRFRV